MNRRILTGLFALVLAGCGGRIGTGADFFRGVNQGLYAPRAKVSQRASTYRPITLRRPAPITSHSLQLPGRRFPVQCATYGATTTCY